MLWGLFLGFTVLMVIRVPVIFAFGGATVFAFLLAGYGDALVVIPQQILEGANSPGLIAIPFFVIAGHMMNSVGVTDRIFNFAGALVGHFRAGLSQVTVLANMVFAGISGSALADIAGLGAITVKAMRERGYPVDFAAALTVASAIMAPVIPPSIAFIVYSALSSTSVARLFLAGLVPGVLLGLALMIHIRLIADRRGFPREPRATLPQLGRAMLSGLPALVAPAIILVGIVGGFVTATEAGVLAFMYSFVLGVVYRKIEFRKLWTAINETMLISSLIMMIVGVSTLMSWLLTIDQASQALADSVLAVTDSRAAFLFALVLFLLFIGCFIESAPAKLILVPILLPLTDQFGVDRIQLGVIITISLAIGIGTPPMGIGLFIAGEVARVPFERVMTAMGPLLIPLILVLLLVTYVPELSLWLPDLVMGSQ